MKLNNHTNVLRRGFLHAHSITKKHARSFYFASRFLPKEKRCAAYSVYAICRISDETVDNPQNQTLQKDLARMARDINLAYSDNRLTDNLLLSFQQTVRTYGIPQLYFQELIDGMNMDVNKNRYRDFGELYNYCYKAAGVIGLIMLKIFECKDASAEKHAIQLGIAMQLTNILRDIKEDLDRGRIYLPQEELQNFVVSEGDLVKQKINDNFKKLLKFQIQRARQYYRNSENGIHLLKDKSSRLVVLTMKEFYSCILDTIEHNNYNIFTRGANISNIKKISVVLKILLKGQYR